jgi:hypothetical protein
MPGGVAGVVGDFPTPLCRFVKYSRGSVLPAAGLDAPGVQVGSLGNGKHPRNRKILGSILADGSQRFFSQSVIVIVSTPKISATSL